MIQYYDILKEVALFRGLAKEELEQLLAFLQAKRSGYKNGQILLLAGNSVSKIWIVLSGTVQVIREDALGNKTIIAQLGPGELFAETFVCAGIGHSPVTVQASSACEILLIDYRRIVTGSPSGSAIQSRLIENMLALLARKNLLLNSRIEILSKRTTREKVLSYLERQREQQNSARVTIPFSRQELADFLCVERSALSRELSRMRDDGLLRFEKNQFELL